MRQGRAARRRVACKRIARRHCLPVRAGDSGRRQLPVRAFRGVGGKPAVHRGRRRRTSSTSTATRYVDYVGSWGPLILGHAHPEVLEASSRTPLRDGTSFGAPTEREVELAEELCRGGAVDGEGAPGVVGHRGDDERAAPRARLHRAQQDRQVRRRLPRRTPTPAGAGRLGRATLGIPRLGRRPPRRAADTLSAP